MGRRKNTAISRPELFIYLRKEIRNSTNHRNKKKREAKKKQENWQKPTSIYSIPLIIRKTCSPQRAHTPHTYTRKEVEHQANFLGWHER